MDNFMAETSENKESKDEGKEGSGWKFWKKVLMWAAVATIVVVGLLALVGNYLDEIGQWMRDRQAARYEQALQKYVSEEKARYAADKDGGATPEETIDLFIAALTAGNIEQASRYYVLEKQEAILADLKDEIAKYDDLRLSIDYFTEVKDKGVKGCNEKLNGCAFEYEYVRTETSTTTTFVSGQNLILVSPAGSKGRKLIDVKLNRLSGVWKIELP